MVTFLFSIHTITKAKQYAGLGRAEPGLEQGLWIFQPGHLTWRATVFSWFMWWIKNADQRQASADPETKPLSQSTYACRFIIYIQHRPLITPKADRPTHFIIPQRVKGGVDLSTAVRVCSAAPVQGCGSITQWFFLSKNVWNNHHCSATFLRKSCSMVVNRQKAHFLRSAVVASVA